MMSSCMCAYDGPGPKVAWGFGLMVSGAVLNFGEAQLHDVISSVSI